MEKESIGNDVQHTNANVIIQRIVREHNLQDNRGGYFPGLEPYQDVLIPKIFDFLDMVSLGRAESLNWYCQSIIQNDVCWERIFNLLRPCTLPRDSRLYFSELPTFVTSWREMCQRRVNESKLYSHRVNSLLQGIISDTLQKNNVSIETLKLLPGATELEIRPIEEFLNRSFPEDVVELFKLHNGQDKDGGFCFLKFGVEEEAYKFLSLKMIRKKIYYYRIYPYPPFTRDAVVEGMPPKNPVPIFVKEANELESGGIKFLDLSTGTLVHALSTHEGFRWETVAQSTISFLESLHSQALSSEENTNDVQGDAALELEA
eukprot:CAMPEP_0117762542 /NCGR_PEP_ID=MMETSP0947-20121206/18001_1 /TAXON_ID=44440 /ORGANISM="Chattonella subsalsa, Strain CCMP2191" /LENGTH=316 /DNA_ID=CAMNT_0005583871 /DNA_START=106 /DNA_END=1056 /DNA_ORIENTATION=-